MHTKQMKLTAMLALLWAPWCRAQGPFAPTAPARGAVESAPPYPALRMPPQNAVLGSIPTGQAAREAIDLTMEDAIARALRYNLALTEGDVNVQAQRAERLRSLSRLLPTLGVRPAISEQQINLAAFGFSLPGAPSLVGPFTLYDARASLSQSVLNFRNIWNDRAARQEVSAAEFSARDVREQVVVVVTGLYLQAIAGAARLEAQQSQVATAEAAYRQALDRRSAGTAPGIDVLRAEVEWRTQQQRLIFFEGEFENQKLSLARAIGLPPGQGFRLADRIPYTPLPPEVTLEATLERAYANRADYRAAEALVRAAESARAAARAGRLPSVAFDANYGAIGPSLAQMRGSFTVTAGVDIPLFQGGRVQADVEAAEAVFRQRRARLEDLRGRIDAEVRTAFTDLRSSSRQVEVAVLNVDLARRQLEQARDRFTAGVTNNLEVVQAQQAFALATENHISALYAFNAAKAALVRSRGDAERSISEYVRRVK